MNVVSKFRALLLVFALLAAFSANAAMISFNGYTLDEDKKIVSGNGLDWIQWSLTDDLSVAAALSQFANYDGGKWVLASNSQMAALFNSFGFAADGFWDDQENTSQTIFSRYDGSEALSTDIEKQFVRLFGNTFENYHGNVDSTDPLDYSAAIFGTDGDFDGMYNWARVNDDYVYGPNGSERRGQTSLFLDSISFGEENTIRGVALVRVSSVSAPTSQLLFFFIASAAMILRVRQARQAIK